MRDNIDNAVVAFGLVGFQPADFIRMAKSEGIPALAAGGTTVRKPIRPKAWCGRSGPIRT